MSTWKSWKMIWNIQSKFVGGKRWRWKLIKVYWRSFSEVTFVFSFFYFSCRTYWFRNSEKIFWGKIKAHKYRFLRVPWTFKGIPRFVPDKFGWRMFSDKTAKLRWQFLIIKSYFHIGHARNFRLHTQLYSHWSHF